MTCRNAKPWYRKLRSNQKHAFRIESITYFKLQLWIWKPWKLKQLNHRSKNKKQQNGTEPNFHIFKETTSKNFKMRKYNLLKTYFLQVTKFNFTPSIYTNIWIVKLSSWATTAKCAKSKNWLNNNNKIKKIIDIQKDTISQLTVIVNRYENRLNLLE